jgi:cytochrome P450
MATLAPNLAALTSEAVRITADTPAPTLAQLAHIPGDDGSPLVGHTFQQLKDPEAFTKKMIAKYGPVYRLRSFGARHIALVGPEANELLLFDRDKIFSSEQAWTHILGRLFPRGLMLLDFEEHRVHRKIMSVAFKTGPIQSYMAGLNDGIRDHLQAWGKGHDFKFYPAIKDLTLRLAAPCFLGIAWGPEADKINTAFVDMVQASIAPIRRPIPGTQMWRGVKGRAFMCDFFAREIPERRARALTGQDDMFTQMCHATDDEGNRYTDQDIIDHMNFLMMAAHDTITSSVSSLVWLLAKNPEWQNRLRQEVTSLTIGDGHVTYDMLSKLDLLEMAFKEALRINPPVPALPRRALRDFEFKGIKIPAGIGVGINPLYTHRSAEWWPDPLKFDPLRFTDENSKGRHRYAWVPFGGGAHMCLGLHFAYMQAKIFFAHLLKDFQIERSGNAGDDWKMWPIPQPKDGLPIRLKKISA